jgi:hypothetical protein
MAQGIAQDSKTIVTLTLPEWSAAFNAAWLRIVASESQGLNPATTYERSRIDRLTEEMTGAAGELAVGKWSNTFFVPSVNTFHRVPDCLKDVEVRSTRLLGGCLIVRGNDADDRRYVLAIVNGDQILLAGWLYGHEAKRDEWIRDPHNQRPAWFAPQESLRGMDELHELMSPDAE